MNKSSICVVILMLSFSVESTFASDTTLERGVAKASTALGPSDVVTATVEAIEPPNDYVYNKAYLWGGDEASPPKTIIKAITVVRNGVVVFIPLSAYADLGDPISISLLKRPAHGFRLIISGGDGGGSYRATLDFKTNEIARRKVVSGEFPKDAWEETTYAFNHLNN